MEENDSAEDDSQLPQGLLIDDNEMEDGEEQPFDISLPASHSYMGPAQAADGCARAFEPGWLGRVPVIAHHGIVFPGETVPILFTQDADMLSHSVHQDKVFGLLCPDEGGVMASGYGVLCEVYEVLPPADNPEGRGDGSAPLVSFKARATHRFRCLQMPRRVVPVNAFERLRFMEVRVLEDVNFGDPLQQVRLNSLDAQRNDGSRTARRLRSMDAMLTPWPLFVYEIFDFRRMRRKIREFFKSMALDNIPEDPLELSFWTASNMALTPRDRLALFVVDDVLLRLHMEVRLISKKSVLCCAACAIEITRRDYIFAMSTEGVHSNYINLSGIVHDIITVSRVDNTRSSGAASAEYSWFPGYAWTITVCEVCRSHVGWRFDAQRRKLRPQRFYGLCRNYVLPRFDGNLPVQPRTSSRTRRLTSRPPDRAQPAGGVWRSE